MERRRPRQLEPPVVEGAAGTDAAGAVMQVIASIRAEQLTLGK